MYPIAADFTKPSRCPKRAGDAAGRILSGLDHRQFRAARAPAFLRHAARMLGAGATLIIGVDLVKDDRILNAAYNDADGVTAAFNLNLLARINRERTRTST